MESVMEFVLLARKLQSQSSQRFCPFNNPHQHKNNNLIKICPIVTAQSDSLTSAGSRRSRRRRGQSAATDLTEIPQMRSNIRNVQSRRYIRIVAGWWLNKGGRHDFLVPVVHINIIDGHRNVVA